MKDLAMETAERDLSQHETGLSLELHDWKTLNKASIKEKVDAVVITIQDGLTDAVDALVFAKKGKELFDLLEKNVRPYAESKSVGKGYVRFGTAFTESMNGVKYDFTNCNDPEWQDLNKKFEDAKKAKEVRETFLKAIVKPLEVVDTETGETHTINPAVKSGKMGFKLEIE